MITPRKMYPELSYFHFPPSSAGDGFHNADYGIPLLHKVLSKGSREKMWTPVKNDYGYGWGIKRMHGHKQIAHGGGINGFATFIGRYPDDDAVVIVLANNERTDAGGLANGLAGVLFGEAP